MHSDEAMILRYLQIQTVLKTVQEALGPDLDPDEDDEDVDQWVPEEYVPNGFLCEENDAGLMRLLRCPDTAIVDDEGTILSWGDEDQQTET